MMEGAGPAAVVRAVGAACGVLVRDVFFPLISATMTFVKKKVSHFLRHAPSTRSAKDNSAEKFFLLF